MTKDFIQASDDLPFNHYVFKFDSWGELRSYFFESKDKQQSFGRVYRGHASAEWRIRSSLERLRPATWIEFFDLWYKNAEQLSIDWFKRSYRLFADTGTIIPNKPKSIDWLSIMQHHGAATRLLDVSTSPFVAAFFALSDVYNSSEQVCIWEISLSAIDEFNQEQVQIGEDDKVRKLQEMYNELEVGISEGRDWLGYSFLELPSLRPHLQRGGFIFSMSDDISIEKLLGKYCEQTPGMVTKLVLDTTERNEVAHALQDFSRMNISFSTLFQGMDGYSKDILVQQFIVNT